MGYAIHEDSLHPLGEGGWAEAAVKENWQSRVVLFTLGGWFGMLGSNLGRIRIYLKLW